MQISAFDFELPEDLVAQHPLSRRDESRMQIVDRSTQAFRDSQFANLDERLLPGDVLVLNNTQVFPAKLSGITETGAHAEILLVRELGSKNVWETLARPLRRLKPGKRIAFGDELAGEVVEKTADGRAIIGFITDDEFYAVLDRIGRIPLPHYIKRDDNQSAADRDRYQTVYAKARGAIAAPTAGLHFTAEVLDGLRRKGVEIVEITLHVGYGTFEPVRATDLSQHSVLPERYEIDTASAEVLNAARGDGSRIVAVGTTTTRALETAITKGGAFVAESGIADLTITPGFRFQAVSALLTNFHLPRSSLLILVSTFGGHELIMKAYKHAVAERYRFYSYGDCMFIE